MFPAAREGDPITHDLVVPSGVVGPPLVPCPPDLGPVFIEGLPAAHVGCSAICTAATSVGPAHPAPPPGVPPSPILVGSPTVFIHGKPAVRWAPSGDAAVCGVFLGDPKLSATRTVFIGNTAPASPGLDLPPVLPPALDGEEGASADTELAVLRKKGAPSFSPPPLDSWLKEILKLMCPKDRAFLDTLRATGVQITAFDEIYFDDPYYDGTKWTTKRFEAAGSTDGKEINMIRSSSAAENAATIYHEGVHTQQSPSMEWRDQEYDAYAKEDAWRISHGLPPHDPSFRTTDAAGKPATNVGAIRAMVDKEYPGVTVASTGAKPDKVVGKTASGKTLLERSDKSRYARPPRKGDSFPGKQTSVPPSGIKVDMSQMKC